MRIKLPDFSSFKWGLRQKLYSYMLLLALILLLTLASALFLFGPFSSVQKDISETLSLQMEFFEKQMSAYWDELNARSIDLSVTMSGILEDFLAERDISISMLIDSAEDINALQTALIDPLCQCLQQSDCSGAFVILETTVNSSLKNSERSRSGLYLQKAGSGIVDREILLYRGSADVGKNSGLMIHRKWRLEFQTDLFPQYNEQISQATTPLDNSYRLSKLQTIPGTSSQARLLMIPLLGTKGEVYGLCGFEVGKNDFKNRHAQPSNLEHLICLLGDSENAVFNADQALSCGITQGYYYEPKGSFQLKELGWGLHLFQGEKDDYIGTINKISLYPADNQSHLAVMIPKADYDRILWKSRLQSGLLLLFILFFSAVCCHYFSRRFLSPLLRDLEKLKSETRRDAKSSIPEIEDLFAFLAAQDRAQEETLLSLAQEKEAAQSEREKLKSEYEKTQNKYRSIQAELSRLSKENNTSVDPEDYQHFLNGIENFTPMEKKVFDLYLSGKKVKEIMEIFSIKESTLRYHNQNIYGKLGVRSLKQLMQYAALMQQPSLSSLPEEKK
ncbi:MAG: LuxR C-terminal-related transcriptional regulator [Bacillota bacterium]|nr:LuxR C-terminal-related transcriptional regulator [Bacillota bacterium]